MGTRSKTSFIKKIGNNRVHLVSVYQQYDGYISGVGCEIANYILSKKIVNGFSDSRDKKIANGFDCLVAQFIRDFKSGVGGLYIITENDTQEYNYNVIFDEDLFHSIGIDSLEDMITSMFFTIEVTDWNGKLLYSGNLEGLKALRDSEV